MKKYTYAAGTFALALLLGGVPSAVFAEEGARGDGDAAVQVRAEGQSVEVSAVTAVRADEDEGRAEVRMNDDDDTWEIDLEDDEDSAFSLDDLKQKIEKRKLELDDEEASTTPSSRRDAIKNANPVRLAVHSLLASKDLLGGIGQQVSVIAREMNDSVASTTAAEAKAQSRGFLTRLFFGGDRTAADVIAKEVAENNQRIADLEGLLGEVGVAADVQATLSAQIDALKDAQMRLEVLAQREQKLWGLFSWRF
ncbi:MAG: hypothetical protein WC790_02610 [Candidatus Paceibacterota bacterium]|jgi:hypothetical protein